ncbi:MAG: RluA family pseudouridine synthase [Candidatus Tectomicrobia bacterium]|nr:RluA family pseudouridine synthase [Candidatus Tectomicrobia bacterium]
MAASDEFRELTIETSRRGERLDLALAALLPHLSRSQAQRLIAGGLVLVNGKAAKAGQKLRGGEQVAVREPRARPLLLTPEALPLQIVYEDDDLLVVNKPAGMVVHPGPGHPAGTLVHALLAYRGAWSSIGGVERPGIVHRLDKGTSGLIAVACHDLSHRALSAQLVARTMRRRYVALVWGLVRPDRGSVEAPIGRHPTKRQQMAVVARGGRRAVTHYRVLEYFAAATLLELRLETGRTHQVRVHLAHLGHGVVGDATYGKAAMSMTGGVLRDAAGNALPGRLLSRPLLHAAALSFRHPRSQPSRTPSSSSQHSACRHAEIEGRAGDGTAAALEQRALPRTTFVYCSAPLPDDFRAVLERLRRGA